MSFASNLLDGFDALGKKTAASLDATQGLGTLFKHLSEVTDDFASKTESALKKYNEKRLKQLEGTVKTSVENVVKEIETLVGEQHGFSEKLLQASKDIDNFAKERDKARKKLMGDGDQLRKDWDNAQSLLRKAKEKYHSLSRDALSAQQTAAKANAAPGAKPKDVQKMAQNATAAAEKAKAAEDKYNESLRETNAKQKKYYTEEQPALLGQFQHFEEERIEFCRSQVSKLLELMNGLTLPEKWAHLCDAVGSAAKSINVESDIDAYAQQLRTNVGVPEPIPFEAPEGGIPPGTAGASTPSAPARSAAASAAGGKQWGLTPADSGLGEDEKRKKLQGQLDELDGKIASMQNQIAAGEKLVQMYAKDPQGKKQAEDKLAEDSAALAELKRGRDKAQRDMDGLGGQGSPAAPAPAPATHAQAPAHAAAEPAPAAAEGGEKKAEGEKCKALYDYAPENDTELEMKEGDIVYVTEKDTSGWWYAAKGDKQGFIPANYVMPV